MGYTEMLMEHLPVLKAGEYVKKPDGSLKPEDIERDDTCRLGKWIHAEVAKPGAPDTYSNLKDAHATFHRASADVVRHANAGTLTEAATANGGEFMLSIGKFFSLLMKMAKVLP